MTEEVKDGIEEMQENIASLKATEEVINEATDTGAPAEEASTDEEQYSSTELKAMEKGWSPDKDNLPEGKEWIGAGEFLRNERLYNEIHKLKRETQATKRDFEVLKEHHKKVAEAEREKLLTQLKHQKKVALEEDDHAAVVDIDEQIMDVKAAKDVANDLDVQEQDNSAFISWVENNSWYEEDDDMRETADEIGAAYMQRMQGKATPAQLFKYVEGRVKKLYANKFASDKPAPRKKAPAVEAGSSARKAASAKHKFTTKDLNEQQLKVMKSFEKAGVLKRQEYIDELVRIGELS